MNFVLIKAGIWIKYILFFICTLIVKQCVFISLLWIRGYKCLQNNRKKNAHIYNFLHYFSSNHSLSAMSSEIIKTKLLHFCSSFFLVGAIPVSIKQKAFRTVYGQKLMKFRRHIENTGNCKIIKHALAWVIIRPFFVLGRGYGSEPGMPILYDKGSLKMTC